MTDPILEVVAAQAARRYARKVWWADEVDLRHEALSCALQVASKWSPEVGVPLRAYAWRAVVLHLRRYLLTNSAPVSESWHRIGDLRGVHAHDLDDATHDPNTPPDEELDDRRWRHDVREQVGFVLRHAFGSQGKLVASAMLDEEDLPPEDVRRITHRARKVLGDNLTLYNLWRQRCST